MDEARLIDKLRLIEALFAGATNEGEKVAAERAKSRILERLKLWEKEDPPVEYRFSMGDMWSRKVFVALLRRYNIRPYRYSGQRYTTVMARVSKRFVDETLWPEYQKISETLRSYLSSVTDRVVQQVIHQDSSEAEVLDKPMQLPLAVDEPISVTDPPKPTTILNTEQQANSEKQANSVSPSSDVSSTSRNKDKRKRRKKRKRR